LDLEAIKESDRPEIVFQFLQRLPLMRGPILEEGYPSEELFVVVPDAMRYPRI
jgi:hypothetical protein